MNKASDIVIREIIKAIVIVGMLYLMFLAGSAIIENIIPIIRAIALVIMMGLIYMSISSGYKRDKEKEEYKRYIKNQKIYQKNLENVQLKRYNEEKKTTASFLECYENRKHEKAKAKQQLVNSLMVSGLKTEEQAEREADIILQNKEQLPF